MGCDGGTIPRRDELVKTKKKPEVKDKDSERLYRWKHCAVSQSVLQHPIVACELGRMYNKEEVISRLISKVFDPVMAHIRGLKDVKELRLTPNPNYREDIPRGDDYFDSQTSEYMCPVTQQEMNGKSKFYFIWTCGCVVSDRALNEIKSSRCHICNASFISSDAIPINPTEADGKYIRTLMEERRAKVKAEKGKKKEKKRDIEGEGHNNKIKKSKISHAATSSTCPSTSTGLKSGSNVSSFVKDILKGDDFKNIRSDKFSVAADKTKSEVYKSIFDSHKSAQNKRTGHWVTCNPQYF